MSPAEQHNNFNTPWLPEIESLLSRLWRDGILAKEIASIINQRFGLSLSKSAITCKVGRMALPPRRGQLDATERSINRRENMRVWRQKNRAAINKYRRERRAFLRSQNSPAFDPAKPRNAGNSPWSPTVMARMGELWARGLTTPAIAQHLNAEFSLKVSERSVQGKARRDMPPRGKILGRSGHFEWTQQQKDRLAALWPGRSSTAIAAIMAAEFDRPFTRNSILGKASKLGLPNKARGGSIAETDPVILAARAERRKAKDRERKRVGPVRHRQQKYQKKIELRRIAPEIEDFSIPTPQRKSLIELGEHDCRWPVGEPKSSSFFFCGAIAEESRPYCSAHCRRAYIETRPR